jgi:hypothetical protein
VPGGIAERVLPDPLQKLPGMYCQNRLLRNGFGLAENEAFVLKKVIQSSRKVLKTGSLS